MEITSPNRTRRFLRTTLLILILASSTVSSARTMQTVSLRFLPCKQPHRSAWLTAALSEQSWLPQQHNQRKGVAPGSLEERATAKAAHNSQARLQQSPLRRLQQYPLRPLEDCQTVRVSAGEHSSHLEQHCVPSKELQGFHSLDVERHNRVVVVCCIVNNQAVGRLFPLKYGGAEILLVLIAAIARHQTPLEEGQDSFAQLWLLHSTCQYKKGGACWLFPPLQRGI